MADYHFPAVVVPAIPAADLTLLESLVLGAAFEAETEGEESIYFFASEGPNEFPSFDVAELRAASEPSSGFESRVAAPVAAFLALHDVTHENERDSEVGVELTVVNRGVIELFQDIVRRSAKIDEIVLTTSYTCTRMRLDGFGGSVTRVTTEAIQFASTTSMLDRMREAKASSAADGWKMLARLDDLAASAGWDSFTPTLQIVALAERQGQATALTEQLERLAADETG